MAAPTFDPNPGYSSTYKPGYVQNTSLGTSNSAWKDAALDVLTYKWASMTPAEREAMGWTSGWPGQLDPTDAVINGNVLASPQTVAVFSRYLDSYQGGGNSWLDSVIPYVPPGPNEYVESPESIANRYTIYTADRAYGLDVDTLALDKYKADLSAGLTEKSIAAQSAASAASTAAQLAAAQIGANASMSNAKTAAEASRYGTQGQFLSSVYGTQGNIYSGQESNRLGAYGQGGNLALGQQGIYDERVNNIIKNLSNPADFVERTYATRALQSPTPTGSVGYQNVGALDDAISKLLNWKASAAPKAPTVAQISGTVSGAGSTSRRPRTPHLARGGMVNSPVSVVGDKPNRRTGAEEILLNPTRAPFGVVSNKDAQNMGLSALLNRAPEYAEGTIQDPVQESLDLPYKTSPIGVAKADPLPFKTTVGGVSGGAGSGATVTTTNTGGPITTVPQTPPAAAPIEVPALVTPTPPAWAPRPGETYSAANGDQWWVVSVNGKDQWTYRGNDPKIPPSKTPTTTPGNPNALTPYWGGWWDPTNGPVPVNPGGYTPQPEIAPGTGSPSGRRIVENGPGYISNLLSNRYKISGQDNVISQIAAKLRNRGWGGAFGQYPTPPNPDTTIGTILSKFRDIYPNMGLPGWEGSGIPTYHRGTFEHNENDSNVTPNPYADPNYQSPPSPPPPPTTPTPPVATTPTTPPNVEIPTYDDKAINQAPFLRYLLGIMGPEQFNTISGAYKAGPFGTALPMGGALNMQKLFEIAQNPDDLAMLSSLYRGANRNLDAEAAMAQARAPYGLGYKTSSIFT